MGREGHCKQVPLACMGSVCSGWTTLGLPQPKALCTSWVQAAQVPCKSIVPSGPSFCEFPGLSHSGCLCSTRAQMLMGYAFCALPRPEPSGDQVLGEHTLMWVVHLMHVPSPGRPVFWVCHEGTVSGVPCISSGELFSGCDTPGGREPSRMAGRHG